MKGRVRHHLNEYRTRNEPTVQECTEILHVADIVIRRAAEDPNVLDNIVTKTLQDVWMLAQ